MVFADKRADLVVMEPGGLSGSTVVVHNASARPAATHFKMRDYRHSRAFHRYVARAPPNIRAKPNVTEVVCRQRPFFFGERLGSAGGGN